MYKIIDKFNLIIFGANPRTISECFTALRLILGSDATVKGAIESGYKIVRA